MQVARKGLGWGAGRVCARNPDTHACPGRGCTKVYEGRRGPNNPSPQTSSAVIAHSTRRKPTANVTEPWPHTPPPCLAPGSMGRSQPRYTGQPASPRSLLQAVIERHKVRALQKVVVVLLKDLQYSTAHSAQYSAPAALVIMRWCGSALERGGRNGGPRWWWWNRGVWVAPVQEHAAQAPLPFGHACMHARTHLVQAREEGPGPTSPGGWARELRSRGPGLCACRAAQRPPCVPCVTHARVPQITPTPSLHLRLPASVLPPSCPAPGPPFPAMLPHHPPTCSAAS